MLNSNEMERASEIRVNRTGRGDAIISATYNGHIVVSLYKQAIICCPMKVHGKRTKWDFSNNRKGLVETVIVRNATKLSIYFMLGGV